MFAGYETFMESLEYRPRFGTITPLSCCRAHRAGHHMAIIIPALDAGFKMCRWMVIVTVINVISQPPPPPTPPPPPPFTTSPSYLLFLLTIGMCSRGYAARLSVRMNGSFHFCFPPLFSIPIPKLTLPMCYWESHIIYHPLTNWLLLTLFFFLFR